MSILRFHESLYHAQMVIDRYYAWYNRERRHYRIHPANIVNRSLASGIPDYENNNVTHTMPCTRPR